MTWQLGRPFQRQDTLDVQGPGDMSVLVLLLRISLAQTCRGTTDALDSIVVINNRSPDNIKEQ